VRREKGEGVGRKRSQSCVEDDRGQHGAIDRVARFAVWWIRCRTARWNYWLRVHRLVIGSEGEVRCRRGRDES